MMPRRAADRSRLLAAAGIVALHAAALLLIERGDTRATAAQEAVVYTQLLLPPAPKPQAVPPAPAPPALAQKPAAPKRAMPATAAAFVPIPAPITPPMPETGQPAAQVPADWADAPAAKDQVEKMDVAALVAAAGANERARRKEPLERLRDSQRIRGDKDDSPAARAIAKTGRADCTKKYAGGASLDPLKLIPLLYDTVTNTGCKW